MPKIEITPLGFFKEAPQVRQCYDEPELRQLGESLKKRQLQPILARPDGTIIAGHRRYRAAKLVGLETLEARFIEGELSPTDIRSIQLTENIHRTDLSGWEKYIACSELLTLNPGWQQRDLAAHLHLDPSQVTRLLSPSKCIQEAQDALKDGRITTSDAYAISKRPESRQAKLLAKKLAGASRDELEEEGRRQEQAEKQEKPPAKTPKIKIPLAVNTSEMSVNGTVTVAGQPGEEITLEEAESILREALKAIREASRQFLDAKTFQAVCRDKFKAG